jgi:membrane fusion protein, multidrug efflux system
MRIGTVSIMLIIMVSANCRHPEKRSDSDGPLRVRISKVTTGFVSIPVHTTGTLVTTEELKLSFKTGGIVSKILVREGDKVKKGDLLALLNLLEINANAEQAKIGYDKALRDYTRAENLFKDGAASLEKKQNAETAMNIAKNSLEIAQFNLQHSRIEAPDNGIVMKQFVKENEVVSPGYPVFLFGYSGKYWKVETGLADKDFIKINPGDSAEVHFDAYPGIKFSALIDQVGELSNPYTGTYEADLILKDAGYRLASGFVASADIFPSVKKSFTMVPMGAIVEADQLHGYIFTVSNEMKASKIYVEIAAINGAMAAVTGIPEGVTMIVTEGAAYLRDGIAVEVVK